MAQRRKAMTKKKPVLAAKTNVAAPRKKRAVVARKKTLSAEKKKVLLTVLPETAKTARRKTPLLLPSETMSFSMAPPENLPVENFEMRKVNIPMIPEFSSEAEKIDIQPQVNLLSTMRTYGTLVAPPDAAVGDAPPGSADTLLTAHEMEEYGLVETAPQPETKTEGKACKRWCGFCLSPRQSFWAGTLFGVAAMGLLTMSLWVLVANNAVQAALVK